MKMREILFRGKRLDNGEWAQGFAYEHEPPLQCLVPENFEPEKSKWYIVQTAFADWNMPRQVEFIEIDPKTVGQFTGLTDKNGKKIFEGDVLRFLNSNPFEDFIAKVVFNDGCFDLVNDSRDFRDYLKCYTCNYAGEIIGNIHDSPEMISQ